MMKNKTIEKLPLPFADKSLGQHFLRDQKVIERICFDFKDQASGIVEIGPGPGILTETLATLNLPYHVIEMDRRFEVYLQQFISDDQITMGDALKINLEAFIKEKFKEKSEDKSIWMVSNLPYNIASPLLINFLQTPNIAYMTLMFQKEVADKVFAFHSTKNTMNSLMVLSQTYFECDLLLKVPPGAFQPPPKVDSAVLTMKRIATPVIPLSDFKKLEKFLRLIYAQKRKQLGGILKAHYEQNRIATVFENLNIDLTVRAESLTLTQIHELFKSFQ